MTLFGPMFVNGSSCRNRLPARRQGARHAQRGFTTAELAVALFLSTLMALGAYAALLVAQQGLGANSAAAELRDNARFATALVQQLVEQAGYQPWEGTHAIAPEDHKLRCAIYGSRTSGSTPPAACGTPAMPANATLNNSDILELHSRTGLGAGASVMSCLGDSVTTPGVEVFSRLYVQQRDDGEPYLMCQQGTVGGTVSTQALLRGVEVFKVHYGIGQGWKGTSSYYHVYGVYKTADEMSAKDWNAVGTLRIGMVLRTAEGIGVENREQTLYPLGMLGRKEAGTAESFTAPADRRLRQTVTLTVPIRNPLCAIDPSKDSYSFCPLN